MHRRGPRHDRVPGLAGRLSVTGRDPFQSEGGHGTYVRAHVETALLSSSYGLYAAEVRAMMDGLSPAHGRAEPAPARRGR